MNELERRAEYFLANRQDDYGISPAERAGVRLPYEKSDVQKLKEGLEVCFGSMDEAFASRVKVIDLI